MNYSDGNKKGFTIWRSCSFSSCMPVLLWTSVSKLRSTGRGEHIKEMSRHIILLGTTGFLIKGFPYIRKGMEFDFQSNFNVVFYLFATCRRLFREVLASLKKRFRYYQVSARGSNLEMIWRRQKRICIHRKTTLRKLWRETRKVSAHWREKY